MCYLRYLFKVIFYRYFNAVMLCKLNIYVLHLISIINTNQGRVVVNDDVISLVPASVMCASRLELELELEIL